MKKVFFYFWCFNAVSNYFIFVNNVFFCEFFFIKFQFVVSDETILHFACGSGNVDLVKYIISLNKIDIKSTTVFLLVFF